VKTNKNVKKLNFATQLPGQRSLPPSNATNDKLEKNPTSSVFHYRASEYSKKNCFLMIK